MKTKSHAAVFCAALLLLLTTACGSVTELPIAPEVTVPPLSETSADSPADETAPNDTMQETTAKKTKSKKKKSSETTVTETTTVPETTTTTTTAPADESVTDNAGEVIESPYCAAYALYCTDTGGLIAGKSLNDRISLASTTKLLTASVALRYLDPDQTITVGQEVWLAQPESTLSYLQPGTQLTVRELLTAMLLPSGNDAAYTVAVCTARAAAGDEEISDSKAVKRFVKMMNSYAAELGMESSHFANPEGWDDSEHYTTMNDMLKLAEHVLTEPVLRDICSTMYYEFSSPESGYLVWANTNKFLDPESYYYRADCIGLKTGTTADAGCCLIGAFKIGEKTYICAVMGCDEDEDRYELMQNILDNYAN